MSHGAAAPGLDRQSRLGAVERLDLRFLVDRQNHGMRRRVHIEPDNVFDLLGEGGIVDRLNVRTRCGWRWCACQMRWTARSDRPTALAMARPVQWVASPDGSAQVSSSTLATVAVGTGFLPGGRVLSRNRPFIPASA